MADRCAQQQASARGRVAYRVLHQILDDTPEQRRVGRDRRRRMGFDRERQASCNGLTQMKPCNFVEQRSNRDLLWLHLEIHVFHACDRQQILDQPHQSSRRHFGVEHRFADLRLRRGQGLERVVEIRIHDRDGILEVMHDELGQLLLLALHSFEFLAASGRHLQRFAEAQEGAYPGFENRAIERLFQELVGARLEPFDLRAMLGGTGDQHDGQVRVAFALADLFEHVDAVEIRHVPIDQDKVDRLRGEYGQRVAPSRRAHDRIAHGNQMCLEHVQIRRLVVNDEDLCRHVMKHAGPRSCACPSPIMHG